MIITEIIISRIKNQLISKVTGIATILTLKSKNTIDKDKMSREIVIMDKIIPIKKQEILINKIMAIIMSNINHKLHIRTPKENMNTIIHIGQINKIDNTNMKHAKNQSILTMDISMMNV